MRHNKVKEGYLVKRSRHLKEWKKRWMVLTKTHLYSFEHKCVYKNPTEKIPLKDVSTLKSYYKNQYEKPQIIRIESSDTFFYLSAEDHQNKWSWMTALEKVSYLVTNPTLAGDKQNEIRQTLRNSLSNRQSSRMNDNNLKMKKEEESDVMKKLRIKFDRVVFQI